MMLQVLHMAEPSLELSIVFQLHRILIIHTLCFYSILFLTIQLEVDPVFSLPEY